MTKVAIVEDDSVYSLMMRRCLERIPDVEVVKVLSNEEEALKWMSSGLSDVECVFVDLQLPKAAGDRDVSSNAGLRLVEWMRHQQRFCGTILILTSSRSFSDSERALAAGCDGYLFKSCELPHSIPNLMPAVRGEVMVVAREFRHVFFRDDLSAKEVRLMEMVDTGLSWAQVADRLGYSSGRAASIIGYRVFDKILTAHDKVRLEQTGESKREMALVRWRAQNGKRS